MLLRERHNEAFTQRQAPPSHGPSGQNPDRIRQAGESFLQAADEAIERALSVDSRAFLQATQQDGGQ